MKRKTAEDYHKLAESRGIKWRGLVVSNTRTKTQWECTSGHIWAVPYARIRNGHGCPICYGNVPRTADDYNKLAKEKDLKWAGKSLPQNSRVKTWWTCSENHRWTSCYRDVRQSMGCPYCADRVPKTFEDYLDLARRKGIEWIGQELPHNNKVKTLWRCKFGHQWKSAYHALQQGTNCPYCAGKAPITPDDYLALGAKKELKWLGPEVPMACDKTWWECAANHRWHSCYSEVRRSHGCPFCMGNAQKTARDYHKLAAEKAVKWLGPEVADTTMLTQWECEKGHRWESCYGNLRRVKGCPDCTDVVNGHFVSVPQRQIAGMINGVLNFPLGRERIDVALPNGKIAIEYDCWYWHGNRKKNDEQRDKELIAANWKVLRIKSNTKLPTQNQLLDAVVRLQTSERNYLEIVLDGWGTGSTFAETRAV